MDINLLSEGQLSALRNLSHKSAGALTAFVNIANARQLTELGLAIRSRQGWDITAAGLAQLQRVDGGDTRDTTPIPFAPSES